MEILKKISNFFGTLGGKLGWVYQTVMSFRKVFLTIPVVYGALRLAAYNRSHLAETVGLNLLENGEYAYTVSRSVAVMGPLAVTAVCLLLMFCSRRTLYPWLISMFSLALPLLILVTNIFPA